MGFPNQSSVSYRVWEEAQQPLAPIHADLCSHIGHWGWDDQKKLKDME